MKKIIIILILFSGIKMNAQDFASPGSTWTYSDHEFGGNHSYPRQIYSIMDTAVLGHHSHMVAGNCMCGGDNVNFIYELNRRVFLYHFQLNQFKLLYDFNLNAGDQYIFYPQNATDSFYVVIDSTGMDTINGQFLKTQFVHVQDISQNLTYDFEGKIIEGIGSTRCLYPQTDICDVETNGLRCYRDSTLGFYNSHLAPSCDTIYLTFDKVEELKSLNASVFPNPFNEKTTIQFDNYIDEGIIFISDVTGRKVMEKNISGNQVVIEKKNLEQGIYYYSVFQNELRATGKLIIE